MLKEMLIACLHSRGRSPNKPFNCAAILKHKCYVYLNYMFI